MSKLTNNPEKKIFYALAGVLFVLMPVMSLNSGISGDEQTFHYKLGKDAFRYYATFGKDTTCLHYNRSVLQMYGPVFDVATVAVIKLLHADDVYKVRHVMNSMTGWAALFFAALIAVMIGGWRAGIITLIFMFLSPRFLGHSFNNPKDIPFAAAYIFTIYAIIRFLRYYPERKYKLGWFIALGIGLTIGVRVGGILLVIYFLFFAGLQHLFNNSPKDWFDRQKLQYLYRILLLALGISLVGYIIGVILWPYAHQAPVRKTIEAMKYMEKYGTSLRQVFEGKIIWSDNVPKYYLPKYIMMTIPEFIFVGLIAFVALIRKVKKSDSVWIFVLLFASIFPVAYIIYKGSNVYGGWRHVSFIYPPLVVISALGANYLISAFRHIYYQLGVTAGLAVLCALPLRHIIANHPLEYIYYNTISGGVKHAYGKYEMDYFYHSLKESSDWLIKNKIDKMEKPAGRKIIVATNHSDITKYYFRHLKDKVKIIYIRYYERGNSDWDFAVLANSYISPYELKRGYWPPKNTIKTIDVDHEPVGAVLQRTDRNDLIGARLFESGNVAGAIPYFKAAIANDKNYEEEYLNLAQAYMKLQQYDQAINAGVACLKLYPNFDQAMNIVGMAYLEKGDDAEAMTIFQQNVSYNPKYILSYYYLGVIYSKNNELDMALQYLEKGLGINASYKPFYYLIARIYQAKGNTALAKQYIDYANSLK